MSKFTTRPVVMGTNGVVTSGHYLASAAGFRIMGQGGNAIDAGAAMNFCLNLLEPHMNGMGGESPTLIYWAKERKVVAISGMGWSPKSFTIEWCKENGIDMIPGDGYLPACVPAIVDTWATVLARYGTMTFSQILSPAIDLAENGFPVYPNLYDHLKANYQRYKNLYPTTGDVYMPDGNVPLIGEIVRNPDYASVLRKMCDGERSTQGGRIAGIEAARDIFYKGDIAEQIVRYISDNPVEDSTGVAHKGLMSFDDISTWNATEEPSVSATFRGLEIHKCSTWTQGPVFLQHLGILEDYNLKSMGHNTLEYLHTWIEASKLAFADREAYYGDPDFDYVPLEALLSKEYAKERQKLIGSNASMDLLPGKLETSLDSNISFDVLGENRRAMGLPSIAQITSESGNPHHGDTTHLDVVDSQGNMIASTPSGGWIGTSPVIKGLGFPLGTRGQMFYLNPGRPNSLQPRKRPRATLTPSLVTKQGAPFMVFGTPGGDTQEQTTLQFFLNHVEHAMDIQESLDAPTVYSEHTPSSFFPRKAHPGKVVAESRISPDVLESLKSIGHKVELTGAWSNGKVMGIRYDNNNGVIMGGASAKGNSAYAIGW